MEPPPDDAAPTACRLCGEPVPAGDERCPSCGLHQSTELSRSSLWRLGAGLAVIYALVALVVALNR